MDPIIGGALIGGASSLLGGLFSSKSNLKATKAQIEAQREFAQHGVTWRVADARQAGLHPLAALGMQPANFSPVVIPDSMGPAIAEAGQNIGRAVQATSVPKLTEIDQLQAEYLRAQIREADARTGLLDSEAARNAQDAANKILVNATTMPDLFGLEAAAGDLQKYSAGSGFVHQLGAGQAVPTNAVTVQAPPMPITTSDPSVMAGDPAMWRQFNLGDGMSIYLPGGIQGDATEVLESLAESPLLMWAVIKENTRRYGKGWGVEMANRFLVPEVFKKLVALPFRGGNKLPKGYYENKHPTRTGRW